MPVPKSALIGLVLNLQTPAATYRRVWPRSPRVQVFRTNASYARWDEGRRSFGAITTVSRDIARQVAGGGVEGWRERGMRAADIISLIRERDRV